MQFLKFVRSIRQLYKTGQCHNFVLGNSGADYDSIFGSFVYAFYLTINLNVLHLPLIDCPQNDIKLRFEVSYVLEQFEIQVNSLLYTEMIHDLYDHKKNFKFILYDHNSRQNLNYKQVTEIIDHHDIQQEIVCPHIIQHCGSAMTLLYYLYNPERLSKFESSVLWKDFHKFLKETNKSQQNHKNGTYDTAIDEFIFYGVQLDSFKFSSTQKNRWNEYDWGASQEILIKIQPKLKIQAIEAVKISVERALSLTLDEHIRKDFKQISYQNFVIHYSTILLNPDLFIKHYWPSVQQKYSSHISGGIVDCFMFAYSAQNGELGREIIFCSPDIKNIEIIQVLLLQLKMMKLDNIDGQWMRWKDPSSKMSRKLFDKELRQHISKL